MPEVLLFNIECHRFFEEPRNALVPAVAAAVAVLSLWPHFATPFAPVLAATFAVMEPHYLNAWSLWPRQIEAFALRPLDWQRAIMAGNLATVALTMSVFAFFSCTVLFLHSGSIAGSTVIRAMLDCLVISVCMLLFGNTYSLLSPRAGVGWTFDDLAGAVMCMVIAGLWDLTLAVLTYLMGNYAGHAVLAALCLPAWYLWSLPETAERLCHNIPELWTNVTQS